MWAGTRNWIGGVETAGTPISLILGVTGGQAIHPSCGFAEEECLFCRGQVAECCLDGGHHGFGIPQQVVDRVVRGEHASPGAEDAEGRPDPPTDRFQRCSENEAIPCNLRTTFGN